MSTEPPITAPNYQNLVANVMANLFRIDIVGDRLPKTNSTLVREVFAIGSTRAHELCKLYDLDPYEVQHAERHLEDWCDGCQEVVDCRIDTCHNCNRRICVDNCIFATNEEHGLSFCEDCHVKEVGNVERSPDL